MSPEPSTGVLCMAYGSPATEADIEPYYTHIRGGRKPSPEALEELSARYRAIDGSPLTAVTRAQAAALGKQLRLPTFVGMKHAPPFIADGAAEAQKAGIKRLVALPLAPHFAEMSVGGYRRALAAAWDGDLVFIPGFHDHPAFISAIRAVLSEALAESWPDHLFFTAHSLPARIVAEGDGYPDRLLESCRLVEAGMKLPSWEFAFQSASTTGRTMAGPGPPRSNRPIRRSQCARLPDRLCRGPPGDPLRPGRRSPGLRSISRHQHPPHGLIQHAAGVHRGDGGSGERRPSLVVP